MKDEIKEILDDVKRHLDYVEATKQSSIRDNEMKAMYDCITNLQEEIENLTHIVANKIIEDYDIDTPLKNQLNKERIKYINLDVVCNDYKSRIDKAIEYNKTHYVIDDPIKFKNDMNDILNGDEE